MRPRYCTAGCAVLTLSLLLAGCGPFLENMAKRRAAYAEAAEGPIVVAVVDDWPDGSFLNGVRLAVDQINESEARLLGRPLQLLVRPGAETFNQVRGVVQSIAANPRVTAVLGHDRSAVAVPASITYEKARVLFMPPFATAKQLTLHGFDFVLRMLPDNKSLTGQIASLSALFGYRRVVVLHDRSDASRAIAFLFEDAARRFDIDIAFRGSFFASTDNYRELIGHLKGMDFDAVFLSTETPPGARMLQQLRELGIDKPVLGSDSLGAGPLLDLAGAAGDRTIIPTIFSREPHNRAKRQFVAAYVNAYDEEPDQAAAQGYDSIKLLATIVERSGTTEARALSTTAHFTAPIAGVTGIYAYDADGNIYGKSYRFKVLRFGRWWPLPGVTIPYLLARFQEIVEQDAGTEPTPPPQQVDVAEPLGSTDAAAADEGMASDANAADPEQRLGEAASGAARTDAGEPTDAGGLDLSALMRVGMGITERNRAWLTLAHEILEFDRLGLVVSPARAHDVAALGLARSLAEHRGFEVEVCELPVPAPAPDLEEGAREEEAREEKAREEEARDHQGRAEGSQTETTDAEKAARERAALESEALVCYSRLARKVDTLFVMTDSDLRSSYLSRLNRALLHFGVSSFALQDTMEHDYGLTLALVSSGLDLQDPNLALRFNGLLNGIRVHELDRKISHLPSVAVDLAAARSLGLFTDPRELTLISDVLDSSLPSPDLSLAEETD